MPTCLIGLGSNQGDRAAALAAAVDRLQSLEGSRVRAVSTWHATAPVGGPAGQGEFLNGAVRLETALMPRELLARLHRIEADLGRRRRERWSARTLDLDLLLYGDFLLETPLLTIPHPRMAFRRFVLEPAAEVAAEMVHPRIGWSVSRLLQHLRTAPRYVALAGTPGSGKTELARQWAESGAGRMIGDPMDDALALRCRDPCEDKVVRAAKELLGQRAAQLDAAVRPDRDEWMLSDFWFDQALAYAALRLSDEQRNEYDQWHSAAREKVTPPRLLVLLDPPRASSAEGAAPSLLGGHERAAEWHEMLSARLRALAMRPGQGPLLHLRTADRGAALAELKAAIDAMR